MATRQKVYARVDDLQKVGRDIRAESHGDPRRMYFYTADDTRMLIGGLTPAQADLWLDGYTSGLYAQKEQTE